MIKFNLLLFRVLPIFVSVIFVGCSINRFQNLERIAHTHDFRSLNVRTRQFDLPVLVNEKLFNKTIFPDTAFIFLEGDGQPYKSESIINTNPTTRNPLSLKLMAKTDFFALYVNRPCYGLRELSLNCSEDYWTSARYSQEILDSLNQGLDILKDTYKLNRFILVGHSGGGTLAFLLAAKRTDILSLVTIAPNLDHRAWSEFYGYPVLEDSLNPINFMPISVQYKITVLIGEKDRSVSKNLVYDALKNQKDAEIFRFAEHSHQKGWEDNWLAILKALELDKP